MIEARQSETYEFVAVVGAQGLRSALSRVIHAAERDAEGCIGVVYLEARNNTLSVIAHNQRRMAAAWVPCRNIKNERAGIRLRDARLIADGLTDINAEVVIVRSYNTVPLFTDNFTYIAARRRRRLPLWALDPGEWIMRETTVSEVLSVLQGGQGECAAASVSTRKAVQWSAYSADDISTTLKHWAVDDYIEVMVRVDIDRPPLYLHRRDGMAAFCPIL